MGKCNCDGGITGPTAQSTGVRQFGEYCFDFIEIRQAQSKGKVMSQQTNLMTIAHTKSAESLFKLRSAWPLVVVVV